MSSHITGFDIGQCAVKMVYFSYGTIKKAVSAEVPDNMMNNGQIMSLDAMADFIAEVSKDNKMPRRDAALVLPASQVITRIITVPAMDEEQLKFNLPYEFKDFLDGDKSYYNFDYEVLENINDDEGQLKEQRIFACAVSKEVLNSYEKMFRRAGYNLTLAVPEEFAYSRYCRADTGIKTFKNDICAMVDLGHSATVVHIINKGEYDSKRSIDIAGKTIEEAIALEMNTDAHLAHQCLITNHKNITSSERCMALYNKLAVEILKAVNFYNYNNRDADLKNLYLVGGGASIEQLRMVIGEVTNIPVDTIYDLTDKTDNIPDPWVYLKASSCAASTVKPKKAFKLEIKSKTNTKKEGAADEI